MSVINDRTYVDPVSSLPAWKAIAVTPSDGADLPGGICRGLEVRTGGTVRFEPAGNAVGSYVERDVGDGAYIDYFVRKVWATGTTATGIEAVY